FSAREALSMNPFQIVALIGLAALIVYCVRGWLMLGRRRMALAAPVFLAAGIAIARPRSIQFVANLGGIRRGTDLVDHLRAFAAMGCYFRTLYARGRLRMQIRELPRQLALAQLPARGALPAEWGQTGPATATESR